MKRINFPSVEKNVRIFRMMMPVFLIIHGTTRISHGEVSGFGEFLNSQGFYFGLFLAWSITIFEIVGNLLIISNVYPFIISLIFVFELAMGIVLAHASNGWFVVGGGTGGMEYSILLILCYLFIGFSSRASVKS